MISKSILTILLLFQLNLSYSCTEGDQKIPAAVGSTFEVHFAPEIAKTSAAYGQIENPNAYALILVGMICEGYDLVEWHSSLIDVNGVMRMRKIDLPVTIESYGKEEFIKGGNHLMLLGRNRKIVEGEYLKMIFTFSNNEKQIVLAQVRK